LATNSAFAQFSVSKPRRRHPVRPGGPHGRDPLALLEYDPRRMSIDPPRTGDEIVSALGQHQIDSDSFWTEFTTDEFFRPIGASWSPAEAVRHLTKSTRPVARALRYPKILLRVRFGASGRPSVSYDALRMRYQQALDDGGKAGRFAPSQRSSDDLDAWRHSIMSEFANVQTDLRTAISRWSEKQLDRLQLPHPLLGKLTVREMLFFTLYHLQHHVAVVKRRLAEAH